MATQIADAGNCITITTNGVTTWTLPKRRTAPEVSGTSLRLHVWGIYVIEIPYSDVSSPVSANVEALRTAVKNFLIT